MILLYLPKEKGLYCFLYILQNVLYVPDLSKNLVSVTAMTRTGAEVYFDEKKCIKNDRKFVIGHAYHDKL